MKVDLDGARIGEDLGGVEYVRRRSDEARWEVLRGCGTTLQPGDGGGAVSAMVVEALCRFVGRAVVLL